jgi:hypothetical protein
MINVPIGSSVPTGDGDQSFHPIKVGQSELKPETEGEEK